MRRAFFIFALIFPLPFMVLEGHADDTQPTEYQLKAAYIYHFAQFVEWPSTAFPQTNAPLVIGILGENPFGNNLQRVVQGKVLGGHPLVVQEFRSLPEMTNNCHVLFIGYPDERLPEILAALNGTSTLTVGESKRFTESGGMIKFIMEGTKIRFQINQTNAEKAGLKMSFKLLSLASKVTH